MKIIQQTDANQRWAIISQWRVPELDAMLLYIRWQICEIYIIPAKLRKHKYIYNIVKETVTLNIKLRISFTLN